MAKDGSYTTYAFEWGYLDMVLKFGALGLFVYLYFVGQIAHKLWKKLKTAPASVIWALASLVVLLTTHIFTPYLNHPLGIGVLIMGAAIAALDKHGGNE
jgi:O-antigen ligase